MAKATTTAPMTVVAPSVTADMSLWKMGKHFVAGTVNAGLNLLEGTNQFAEAFNEIGQASNAMARVVKDYALVEESEAMGLLQAKRALLN